MSTHNPFVICKAAAGSGKTFNLVKEYLKLAMAGGMAGVETRFRGILAITFTNKAANEMKERVMDTLGELENYGIDPDKSKMGTPLLEALNAERPASLPPFDEWQLKQMASRLRGAILHRYSDLSVCTIDSFMHRVVRTFAHDLGQPVNFEVMIEQDDLIDQAVSRLMSQVGTDEALTDVVQHYAVSRMENERGFDIEWSLRKLAKQLFSEGADVYLERLRRYEMGDYVEMYRRYEADNQMFLRKMESLGKKAVELLDSAGMSAESCVGGKTGFFAFFQKMSRFEKTLRAKQTYKPSAKVAGLFAAVDYGGATICKDKSLMAEADRIASHLLQIYNDLEGMLGEPMTDYNTRSVLLRELYSMALLGELDRQLHEYAKENEVVHLSDFNRLINKIVQEEPAPFIYERLGNRYHHFLIDEFQDTSVLQWHNLVPLLDNGVGQGYESLVVGDGKQAIYRFRQGDVRQFIALPKVEGLELHGASLSQPGNYRLEQLDVNYRTADAVVDFNNAFFSWLVREHYNSENWDLAKRIYLGPNGDCKEGEEELRQKHNEKKAQRPMGHVGVRFVDGEDEESVCRKVLVIIDRLVGEQGYQARDIMILGRNKRDLAAVGSYLLANSHYEQSSAESFYLRGSQAVLALVSALRCLHDGADREAAAELLHRLFILGILRDSHDEVFLAGETVPLKQALATEGIDFDAGRLLSTDLYDCCEELVRRLRLDQIDVPYVASLLNKVAAFASRRPQGIGDFLEWFDEHPDLSAASSSEGNALRLMTIHKAKGLEAPVVICPFFKPSTHLTTLWVDTANHFAPYEKSLPAAYVTLGKDSTRFDSERDREKEASAVDDLNILYVAFTRPQEQLFVVAQQPKENSTAVNYSSLLFEYTKGDADYGDVDFQHEVSEKKETENEEESFVDKLSYIDWTDKVKIASPSEKTLTPLMEERVRFGIHAHALMAEVEHADDVAAAMERYAAQQMLDNEERQRLEALACAVVTHPDTARFFAPAYKVKNECDLTDGVSSGRPDRVVFAPDETWVVDFKTGVDLHGEYDLQLQHYCRALTAMGYPKVSGWLVFLQPQIHVRQIDV